MNDEIHTEVTLTPEQIEALRLASSGSEASPEEAEVFITEDTADHSVTIH